MTPAPSSSWRESHLRHADAYITRIEAKVEEYNALIKEGALSEMRQAAFDFQIGVLNTLAMLHMSAASVPGFERDHD